jgi:hypothetical protein
MTGGNKMRDLQYDLKCLTERQQKCDLPDDYLESNNNITRKFYENNAPEFSYGITFVESTIAREWLERAIKAEKILKGE